MTRPLFVARLTGTQEQMGAQHGRLAAADAVRILDFYRTMPERMLAGELGAASKFVVRQVANLWQARLTRERPAELAARSRAFVDAVMAEQPHPQARAARHVFATMDSMQNCVSLAARTQQGPFGKLAVARAAAAAAPACSTLIAWGRTTEDGELLFGRNFDFPGVGVWDAAPAFIVCSPDSGQHYGFFTTRGADTPVVTVVNEAGLVIAPHTRWHRDVTFGGAMIVDIVHDIARRAETLADAIAIGRERKPSSSWGIAIGSARERSGIVLEIAGPAIEVVYPAPGAEHLVCANRYRTEALQARELAGSAAWVIHSERREARLRALVQDRTSPLAARDISRFLGDRVDHVAGGRIRHLGAILAQATNVHCVVVKPSALRAWQGIDRAPSCEGTWAELGWTWDGPAGGWEIGSTGQSGFTATVADDHVAPHDEATRHVREAARAYEQAHDVGAARASIERAIRIDPDDPSLRLAATWLALEDDRPDRAILHVHAGLAAETEPYRRGQLLLWGSRAAQAGDPEQARSWREQLDQLPGHDVDELRAAAGRRWRGKPHVNLMMADAF
jgi:hypothetical protein